MKGQNKTEVSDKNDGGFVFNRMMRNCFTMCSRVVHKDDAEHKKFDAYKPREEPVKIFLQTASIILSRKCCLSTRLNRNGKKARDVLQKCLYSRVKTMCRRNFLRSFVKVSCMTLDKIHLQIDFTCEM